jgi:hypothetical protein
MTSLLLRVFALIGAVVTLMVAPAYAQGSSGSIGGRVVDAASKPLGGATVQYSGATSGRVSSGADGSFMIAGLAPGVYRITVSKPGYSEAPSADIVVTAGQIASITPTLIASSFSSLQEIGRVSSTSSSIAINTSAAAVSTISQQTLVDQGDPQVKAVLQQIPGVVVSNPGVYGTVGELGAIGSNGASPGAQALVQIRGALAYETESLIDGHPIALGRSGAFDASYLTSYFLQDIEVVKGPGSVTPNVNYAINGTVNYRTLDPTPTAKESVDLGIDRFGGTLLNARLTGTTGHLGYAFDYLSSGTPGAQSNYPGVYTFGVGAYTFINGLPVNTMLTPSCNYGGATPSGFLPGSELVYSCPDVLANSPINTQFFQRAGLAKLRYAFSPSTSVTASYITSYQNYMEQGTTSFYLPGYTFDPGAGYTGPSFSGANCCNNAENRLNTTNVTGLFQAEFRTSLGLDSFLAQYYRAGSDNNLSSPWVVAGTQTLYGGPIYLYGAATPTIYTGQSVSVANYGTYYGILDLNTQSGFTVEDTHPISDIGSLTASYDREHTTSYTDYTSELTTTTFANNYLIPAGSGQTFGTVMIRADANIAKNVAATLGYYFINYDNHYASTGSTFQDSSSSANFPRLATTWRASSDTSVRFSTGGSIAPPYIYLVGNPGGPPQPNNLPVPTYFTQTVNSGNVLPEEAWSYDLGADQRIGKSTVVSADLYLTKLRDQYLNEVVAAGTVPYNGVDYPLYQTTTANLGHSQYSGVEISARHTPASGLGYTGNVALVRAYPYDLPPNIYSTASGPYTTNLAVIPNANFFASGPGFNGISPGSVPYATGYAEVNYTTRHGLYASFGETYFGNNNSYDEPAFFVSHATLRIPLTKNLSVQASGDNLFNAYGQSYYNLYGGVPIPLANGYLGPTSAGNYGPATVHVLLHINL